MGLVEIKASHQPPQLKKTATAAHFWIDPKSIQIPSFNFLSIINKNAQAISIPQPPMLRQECPSPLKAISWLLKNIQMSFRFWGIVTIITCTVVPNADTIQRNSSVYPQYVTDVQEKKNTNNLIRIYLPCPKGNRGMNKPLTNYINIASTLIGPCPIPQARMYKFVTTPSKLISIKKRKKKQTNKQTELFWSQSPHSTC